MSSSPIPEGPFANINTIGGPTGNDFSTCGWVTNEKASVVTQLQVWWNGYNLQGVQVTYSDDTVSALYGAPNNDTATLILAPGERITSMTLWGNGAGGAGTRTGRVRMTTDKWQNFDHGKDTTNLTAYPSDVGSGSLVGMIGKSSWDIDMLGFLLLSSSVSSIAVSGVEYTDDLTGTQNGLSQITLDEAHFEGADPYGANWAFSNTVTKTESTTFTQRSTTTWGAYVPVTVNAAPFSIGGSASTGFTWAKEDARETITSTINQLTLHWGIDGHLAPGEGLTCSSLSEMGVGHARYNATVTISLYDGTVSTYSEPGVFNNVTYTQAWVTQVPQKKPPNTGQGTYGDDKGV